MSNHNLSPELRLRQNRTCEGLQKWKQANPVRVSTKNNNARSNPWPFLSSNWIATSVREERSQATMAITDAAFVNILTWIITNKEQAASLLLSTVYCTLHTRQQPSDPLLSVVFWLTAELNPRVKLTLNSLHLFVHILSRIRLLTVQQLCRISQRDIAAIPRVQHDISANNLPQSRQCQIIQCWPSLPSKITTDW